MQQDFLTNLSSPSFETYIEALSDLPEEPLDDASFFWLTRLFRWYTKEYEFSDIRERMAMVWETLSKYASVLDVGDYFDRKDWRIVSEFLKGYLEEGRLAHEEMLAATTMEIGLRPRLVANGISDEDLDVMDGFIDTIKEIETEKHSVYWKIRDVGEQHLYAIRSMLPLLAPGDQGFVLHALDHLYMNAEVIALMEEFIQNEKDEYMQDIARKYLKEINGSSEE